MHISNARISSHLTRITKKINMKNIVLAILTVTSIHVSGQHLIGVKGGVSITNISSTEFLDNHESRTGFCGGLSYEYFSKDNHSISVDLVFHQRGFISDVNFFDDQGNPTGQAAMEFRYDYLSMPIKTGIHVGERLSAFGNLGIVPAILINAKTKTPSYVADGIEYPSETIDVTDVVTKFDFAGLIEIGVNYKTTEKFWLFSALAYQSSFTTLTNSNYFADSKIKHNGLTLCLGVKFQH